MELFIFGAQVPQNLYGLGHAGGLYHNLLETAVQGAVLLHYLGKLVQGGGANALELSPGQGRLEHVGSIQAAGSATRPHNGMELVYEQDNVRVLAGLLNNGFEALLKISAVLGARHHGGNVQRKDALFGQSGRYIPMGNLLGYTLYNGRFPHTGLSDEHGVVLFASAQNLYDAGNLVVPAHHRVQLALAGSSGKVIGKLLNVQLLLLGLLIRSLGRLFFLGFLFGAQKAFVFHEGQQSAIIYAMTAQIYLAIAFRGTAKGQQKMLGLRQGALQAGGLHDGNAKHILRLAGEGNVVQLLVGQGFPGEDALVYERLQIGRLYSQALQGTEGSVLFLTDDSQEKMVRADAVTAGSHGLFAGIFDDEVKVLRNL